jgi:hypothetical protein
MSTTTQVTEAQLDTIRQIRQAAVDADLDRDQADDIALQLRVAERYAKQGKENRAAKWIREAEETLCAAAQVEPEGPHEPASMRQAMQGTNGAPTDICQHCGEPIEMDAGGNWMHEGDLAYCPDNNEEVGDRIQRAEPIRTVVKATRIIGTDTIVYSAWESSTPTGAHATITRIDDEWFGKIGTRRPPAEVTDMPAMSDERYAAARAHYAAEQVRAITTILDHEPRLNVTGYIDGCEITEEVAR